MKRKAMALGLSAAMLLSMAACANGKSNTPTNDTSVDETLPANEEFFPLETPVNVTIAATRHDDYTEVGKTVVMQKMQDKTNVQVDWLDWPMSILKEKRGLAFSGDTLPDAFYGSYVMSNNDIVTYGAQDYFVDFTPYIENGSMPNFSALIEKDPQIMSDITAPDGKIYALPTIQLGEGKNLTSDTVLINKTWLDKVNMPVPTTTEELYAVLKAFDEAGDLNGNGKDDEIPMTFRYGDNNNGCWGLLGWFGTPGGTSRVPVMGDEGKLVFAQATDNYKDAMKYFNRLYSEGLLDPEVFTMDTATYNAKAIAEEPVAGVLVSWSSYQVNNTITNGDEYVYLPPLKADNGTEPKWQTRAFAYNRTAAFLISADSEHIAELVKWADMWYDVDTSIEAMYGGEEYVQNLGDGKYTMLPGADGKETTWSTRSAYCPGNDALSAVMPENFQLEPKKQSQIEKTEADELYKPYLPTEYYNEIWYATTEESEDINNYRVDFDSYLDQMAADFITKGDVDGKWDNYIQSLNNLNMPTLLEIYQAIYDRNVK